MCMDKSFDETSMNCSVYSKGGRGFTLIEILVALVIVTVSLAALITESSQNLYNAAALRDKTLAHWVGMNKVTEWQLSDKWPAAGRTQGEMTMGRNDWYWTMIVRDTDDKDVRRIDVEVRHERKDDQPRDAVIAYLGRPEATK